MGEGGVVEAGRCARPGPYGVGVLLLVVVQSTDLNAETHGGARGVNGGAMSCVTTTSSHEVVGSIWV